MLFQCAALETGRPYGESVCRAGSFCPNRAAYGTMELERPPVQPVPEEVRPMRIVTPTEIEPATCPARSLPPCTLRSGRQVRPSPPCTLRSGRQARFLPPVHFTGGTEGGLCLSPAIPAPYNGPLRRTR